MNGGKIEQNYNNPLEPIIPSGGETKNIEAVKLPLISVRQLLSLSWRILKNRFWKFIIVGVTFLVVGGLIIFLFGLDLIYKAIDLVVLLSTSFLNTTTFVIIETGIVILLGWLLILLLQIIVIFIINNREISFKDLLKKSFSKVLGVMLISILIFIIANIWTLVSVIVNIGIGTVLFIIPGIIFSILPILFIFSVYAYIFEDTGLIKSLVRSSKLVKNYFWAVLGRVFILGLMIIIVGINFMSISSKIFFSLGKEMILRAPASIIIGAILFFLCQCFNTAYIFLLYRSLKSIKDENKPWPVPQGKNKTGIIILILIILFIISIVLATLLASHREYANNNLWGTNESLNDGSKPLNLNTEETPNVEEGSLKSDEANKDIKEILLGKDSDGDGLSDDNESRVYHTNPLKKDSDDDGLNDFEEIITYATDPNNPDTDGYGYLDGEEVKAGYNPNGLGKIEF